MFLEAIEGAPDHPEAAKALNNAALAYEEVDRRESAMGVWRRIINEHQDSEFVDVARFRLAYNASRFFEYDEAVDHFQILIRTAGTISAGYGIDDLVVVTMPVATERSTFGAVKALYR